MPETIKDYLETAAEQIRWRRARPVLIRELERHLEDQRDDLIKQGRTEAEAERLAVEDMGDPVTVGTGLDAVHRPKPQWGLLGLAFALAAAGAVLRVVFRQISGGIHAGHTAVLMKVTASLVLGTAAMLGMYFLDVSRLARHARAVYIGVLAAGVLTLPLTHSSVSYYTRYVVLLYPAAYALWLSSFRGRGWRGFFLSILGGVFLSLVCCMAPSMMGLLLLLFSGLVLTICAVRQDWFGTGRRKGLCAVLGIVAGILAFLFFQGCFTSFWGRVQIALHPEMDPYCKGFMGWILCMFREYIPPLRQHGSVGAAVNAGARIRVFTNNANIFGETMPIDYGNDYLPLSMAVSWGWVPLLLLLASLTALLLWLLVKGLRQKYLLGRFVVLAVVITLAGQMLFSTMLNMGFVLFSASLPLVVGNLQTVFDMALIGLALSVFRGESISREEPAGPLPQRKRLRIRFEYQ